MEVRCAEDGRWYAAGVERVDGDGGFVASYRRGGFVYFCAPRLWRVPELAAGRGGERDRDREEEERKVIGNTEVDYRVGQQVWGTVASVTDFGAFVYLGANRSALLHVSNIATDKFLETWEDIAEILPIGEEIGVWVSDVDEDGRLGVTMKGYAALKVGEWLTGVVESFEDRGITVDVRPPGAANSLPGLVHLSDMEEGSEVEVGQAVRVRVRKVDLKRGTCTLSMKESDEIDVSVFRDVPADKWLKGTVTAVQPYGAFVQVQPPSGGEPVVGLVHKSNMNANFVDNVEDEVKVGQEVGVRILSLARGKLTLSMVRDQTEDLPIGKRLRGTVQSVQPDLAIIKVQARAGGQSVIGKLFKVHMKPGGASNAADEVEVGQEINVWAKKNARGKILFSMLSPPKRPQGNSS